MSNVVEDRIINLKFNNKDFEKNAAQSMKTIDQLEEKLSFKKIASSGANVFGKLLAANKTAFETTFAAMETIADKGTFGIVSNIKNAFSKNGDMFSPLLEMATGAFRQIGQEAYQLGKNVATSLTTEQIDSGWQKYADKTKSVQTIMNATGWSIEKVTEQLDKLNWYSDETSYSYTDMTSNIAKFTSAGVELDTAVTAMIGIGNAAGLAGSSVQDASHAMEGFAKAIGQGYMDRLKWGWIETAQMDTQQFKKSLIEAAVALGELHSNGDGTYYSNNGKELTSLLNFENDLASGKWMTREVMLRALQDYGALTNKVYDIYESYGGEKTTSEILDEMGVSAENLGLKSLKASQEAKTFSDAIESVKDAVSTGWMTTFDTIFGNYVEAKKLWTDFANWLYDMFAESGNYRNEMFDIFMGREAIDKEAGLFYRIGDDLVSGREYLLQAIYKFMDVIQAYADAIKKAWDRTFGAWDYNTIGKIAKQIHRVAEILGATLEKDVMMDPRKVSELEWLDNKNRNSFITYFRLAMESFFRILKESVETIKVMGKTFYQALYDAFGNKSDYSHGFYISGFYKWFKDITTRVAEFIKVFRQVITESDRFKRILDGNFSILKIFFTIIQANVDFMIENGGGVIGIIAEFLATLGDIATAVNKSNLYNFVKGLLPMVSNIIKTILDGIISVINVVIKVKDFVFGFFTGLDERMGESGAFQKFLDGLHHLGDSLANLLGMDEIKGFLGSIGEGFDSGAFLDAVVTGADNAVAAVGGFLELIGKGIDQIKAFGDEIGKVASNIGAQIDKVLDAVFGSGGSGGTRGMPGDEEKESIFVVIKNQVTNLLSNLFKDVDNKELERGATEYSTSVVQGVVNGFKKVFSALEDVGIDWDKIKAVSIFTAFIVTIVNLNNQINTVSDAVDSIAGSISSVPEAISGVMESVSGVFDGVGESISDFLDGISESLDELVAVEKIEMIANVISTMAMIVMLLATIPEQSLAKGVTYLGIICTIFVLFQKAMGVATALVNLNYAKNAVNISKSFMSGNTMSWNAGLLGPAALVVGLAYMVTAVVDVIKTIVDLNASPGQIIAGVSVVAGIMVAVGIFLAVISKTGKGFITTLKNESLNEVTTAKGRSTGSISENTMTGPSGKLFYGVAAAILALSVGIKIIVDSIKTMADTIAEYHTKEYKGVMGAAIAVVTVVFSLVIVLFTIMMISMSGIVNSVKSPTEYAHLAATMTLVAASIMIIVLAVDVLIVGIGALALAFAGVNKIDESGGSVAAAIITVIGITLILFVSLLALMKEMEKLTPAKMKSIGMMMILVGSAIAIMVGSIVVLVGAIIGLILVFTLHKGVSKYLTNEGEVDNTIKLAIGTVLAVLALIGVFVFVLLKEMEKLTPAKMDKIGPMMLKMSEAIIIIAAAVLVIGVALAIMAKAGVGLTQSGGLAIVIGVIMAGVITGLVLMQKFKVKPEAVKNLADSILKVAASILVIAGAVAVLSIIDMDKMGLAILALVGIVGVLTLAVVGLAYLAKSVPGTQVVIAAFASMLMSLALIAASIAGTFIGFSIAVATVTKCLPKLTEVLGPFTNEFVKFLSAIATHGKILVELTIVMSLFGIVVAMVVAGVVLIIMKFRTQISAALSGAFDKIKDLFRKFLEYLNSLPGTTKALISAFVLAISAGFLAATPEMYANIEAGFMLIMERLGDSVGWIVKGLLALVINIINSLADAIRAEAPTLAYAIYSALEAIAEVLLDLLVPAFDAIVAPIQALFSTVVKAFLKIGELKKRHGGIFNIWNASEEERALAEKEWQEFASKGFGGLYQEELKMWQSSYSDGTGSLKELMRIGLTSVADAYGIDPTERLKTLEEETRKEATEQLEKTKKDMSAKAKDTASGIGGSFVDGLSESGEKLRGWFGDTLGESFNFDIGDLKNKISSGEIGIGDVLSQFQDENGNFSMNGLIDLDSMLNAEGDNYDFSGMAEQITNTGGSIDDLNNSAVDAEGNLVIIGDLMDKNTASTDNYSDSLDRATQSEQELAEESDNLEAVVSSKKQAFYDAGSDFASAVEEGFNADWTGISDNIRSKFKALADDIREMLEMKDVDLKVGIKSVTPVYEDGAVPIPTKDADPYDKLWNPTSTDYRNQNGTHSTTVPTSSIMAESTKETINETKSIQTKASENTVNLDDVKDLKSLIGAIKDAIEYQNTSGNNVYLDSEKVGVVMRDQIEGISVEAVNANIRNSQRSGG